MEWVQENAGFLTIILLMLVTLVRQRQIVRCQREAARQGLVILKLRAHIALRKNKNEH